MTESSYDRIMKRKGRAKKKIKEQEDDERTGKSKRYITSMIVLIGLFGFMGVPEAPTMRKLTTSLGGLVWTKQTSKENENEGVANMTNGSNHNDKDNDNTTTTIEDLLYKYGSDKSRDDHGYSKFYDIIFGERRQSIRNMTEIGVSAGQSIQAWYQYFPNAEIHGFYRWELEGMVKNNMDRLKPRVHIHIVDMLRRGHTTETIENQLGFQKESMDLIIEDSLHSYSSQKQFLIKLFPFVKPGGYYIIEDVGFLQGGYSFRFEEDIEVKKILEEHDTIWIDTGGIGHRKWDEWASRSGNLWVLNRTHHNSNLVVIQKRIKPLRPPQINLLERAMKSDSIIIEEEPAEKKEEKERSQ